VAFAGTAWRLRRERLGTPRGDAGRSGVFSAVSAVQRVSVGCVTSSRSEEHLAARGAALSSFIKQVGGRTERGNPLPAPGNTRERATDAGGGFVALLFRLQHDHFLALCGAGRAGCAIRRVRGSRNADNRTRCWLYPCFKRRRRDALLVSSNMPLTTDHSRALAPSAPGSAGWRSP